MKRKNRLNALDGKGDRAQIDRAIGQGRELFSVAS